MNETINIYLNDYNKSITIPFSTKHPIDIKIGTSFFEEGMTLGVTNFPLFQHASIPAIQPIIEASIKLNLVSKALITKIDPLKIANIDSKLIKDLDIDRNETYYNTN